MFKGLILAAKGWFRAKAEDATDLRLAGREHIFNVNQSIEAVRAQRNEVAGKGIILEERIANLEKDVQKGIAAVKHWATAGDEDKKQRAYQAYQKDQQQLDKLKKDLVDLQEQVADLDAQIRQLENDTEEARDNLDKAATNQVLGKAASKVEGVHKDIKSGPLAGAIERSKQKSATAEATRRARVSSDNRDLYAFDQGANVLSMDDILGTTKTEPELPRGNVANVPHVDEASFRGSASIPTTVENVHRNVESSRSDDSSSSSSSSDSSSSSSSSD